MRANYLHLHDLVHAALAEGVQGILAEFGVWHGTTFLPLAEVARRHGRTIHAIDSFQGMDQETDRDGGKYRRGQLSVGGSATFRLLVKPYGPTVQVHEGWVPQILDTLPTDERFAFVHLDLDQYRPTRLALDWLWPRMAPGGVLVCHDWIPHRDHLAAGAIAEWMAATQVPAVAELESHHIVFRAPRAQVAA